VRISKQLYLKRRFLILRRADHPCSPRGGRLGVIGTIVRDPCMVRSGRELTIIIDSRTKFRERMDVATTRASSYPPSRATTPCGRPVPYRPWVGGSRFLRPSRPPRPAARPRRRPFTAEAMGRDDESARRN